MLAVVGLIGCTPAGIAEQSIARELTQVIGPAARYDVDIQGLKAFAGEADRILIVGQRVQRPGAPVLDQLTIELRGVKYNRGESRLEQLAGVDATARITAADIATFLEGRQEILTATVVLRPPDQATLRVRPDLGLAGLELSVGLSVEATGALRANTDRIYFVVSDVRAAGFNLGDRAAQALSQVINPLVNLSDLPLEVEVTSLQVENEAVQVKLTGDPASLQL
jgi:hypothetical protein